MSKPWDRLSAEGPTPFQAFEVYTHLGLTRSLQKVSEQVGTSVPMLKKWSVKFHWIERAQAWDNHCVRAQHAAQAKAITKAVIKSTMLDLITAENLVLQYARIAFFNIADVCEWDKHGEAKFKPLREWTEDQRAVIKSIHMAKDKGGRDSIAGIGFENKISALHTLATIRGLFSKKAQTREEQEREEYMAFIHAVLDPVKFKKLHDALPKRPVQLEDMPAPAPPSVGTQRVQRVA
jgi:hypothetical protein